MFRRLIVALDRRAAASIARRTGLTPAALTPARFSFAVLTDADRAAMAAAFRHEVDAA